MPSATDLFCVFKNCLLGNSASEAIKCLHKKKILTKVSKVNKKALYKNQNLQKQETWEGTYLFDNK